MSERLPSPSSVDIEIRMQDGVTREFNFRHDNTTVRLFLGVFALMNHVSFLRPDTERPLLMYGYPGLPEFLADNGLPTLRLEEPSQTDAEHYLEYMRRRSSHSQDQA